MAAQVRPDDVCNMQYTSGTTGFPKAILPAGNDANAINVILDTLASGQDLTADMASAGFSALMDGTMTPSQAGSFLMGLRMKGESALELAHATRAALARALNADPQLLLLDEPFTGLDGDNRRRAAACVLAQMAQRPVLLVTHDRADLEALNARIIELRQGEIRRGSTS